MVILPDTQILVQYWPESYYNQMQWIADNKETLNIQAVLHMGDMVNNNNEAEWTVCEKGTDIINESGIAWMPMMGNHDNTDWFNLYYDYATYGMDQSWFGGSYHADKLDHTYWFVTVGEREYLILSLGWAPTWDVLEWAQGIVEEHSDKNVILACHAYMNSDGTLLSTGDAHCVSSYYAGYPNGDDVWNAFKGYRNVVLAMGGHIHNPDIVTFTDENGDGRDVTSLLVDRQNDDATYRYAMVAVLTFHADSNEVDVNWYSTRYDALYKTENQFSIEVPHFCEHTYTTQSVAATCTTEGGTEYVCTLCGHSYIEGAVDALGHDFIETVTAPTCVDEGYTALLCSRCSYSERKLTECDITEKCTLTEGLMIQATSGKQMSDVNWMATDYVNISAYEQIDIVMANTATIGSTIGLAFYDSDKNYVCGVSHDDGSGVYGFRVKMIDVPKGAVYLRSTWYSVNHSKYDASAYEFYCKGLTTRIPATGEHTYNTVVTPPTCTENGYTTHTCACGESYVDDYTESLGHSYENRVCTLCGEEQPLPIWEKGTIAYVSGLDRSNESDIKTRFRTVAYHRLSDYNGVGIQSGYEITNFVYDENYTYLGSSNWLGDGLSFTASKLLEKYPNGVYFRVALRAIDQRELSEDDLITSGVKFYLPEEEVPAPKLGFTAENITNIGVWQDGAIWNGKLFVLNAGGAGAVYDLETYEKSGTFAIDKKDVLKPHANSVCFGSTYFAEGDQYPLLYVNIYNNYASAEDRKEGTCCVYRITEADGVFATELVQVIRIGFTEDLTLWKSKENNGDIRPYGNFVVDTDEHKLYAFVMRDMNKTTRFFGFDIPDLEEGVYEESYGCNLVTLNKDDIQIQFDTDYFRYLQGCCYSNGMILSLEDFGGNAPLRVVDLKTQSIKETYYFGRAGITSEPEVLCVDPDTGTLYYAPADGILRVIVLDDVHFHGYTATVTPPTCTEQGYTTYTCECGESYVDTYTEALGHTSVTDEAKAPTCTKTGLTEGSHCSVCGEILIAQEFQPYEI